MRLADGAVVKALSSTYEVRSWVIASHIDIYCNKNTEIERKGQNAVVCKQEHGKQWKAGRGA